MRMMVQIALCVTLRSLIKIGDGDIMCNVNFLSFSNLKLNSFGYPVTTEFIDKVKKDAYDVCTDWINGKSKKNVMAIALSCIASIEFLHGFMSKRRKAALAVEVLSSMYDAGLTLKLECKNGKPSLVYDPLNRRITMSYNTYKHITDIIAYHPHIFTIVNSSFPKLAELEKTVCVCACRGCTEKLNFFGALCPQCNTNVMDRKYMKIQIEKIVHSASFDAYSAIPEKLQYIGKVKHYSGTLELA